MIRTLEIPAVGVSEPNSLTSKIQTLVTKLNPEVVLERRHDQRFPMPILLKLTPLDANGQPLVESAIIVAGKDISRCGMSFFHERPLHYRRAIVTLEHPELGWFAAEIDIHWCRFTKPGWYISGGRLVAEIGPDRIGPHSATLHPGGATYCHHPVALKLSTKVPPHAG